MKNILTLVSLVLLGSPLEAAPVASGKLVVAKEIAEKAKGIRTVFISIQDPKAAAPMPCAAQKLELQKDADGEFTAFSLDTPALMMMTCTEIPAVFNLKVKLDRDGNAGRDTPGDLVGTATGIKKGASNLKIVIDKAI